MKLLLSLILCLLTTASALAFDQHHAALDALLKKHVRWDAAGVSSKVNYAGFKLDSSALDAYLVELSSVQLQDFKLWSKPERLAFLINAYNAYTIKFILSDYPDIASIKDLGSLFSSPWDKKFFALFGEKRSLNNIEHDIIRVPGAYDDPRIHAALVCASIGCPGIRNEAFNGALLDQQLEDSLRRFLSDSSRNRYNPEKMTLEISKIFDWYADDFSSGFRGHGSLRAFLGDYAEILGTTAQAIKSGKVKLDFLDYDWRLNQTAQP